MALPSDPVELADAVVDGDRRALARAITVVEEGREGADAILAACYPRSDRAYRIGITGAPGAGKSTLTDRLIAAIRATGDEIAVVAVDPSSPFSGGAVLGDRVRMQDHITDPGVYVRSMASRGHLGGLSAAAPRALAVVGAAGFPWILVETVGVGQDEVEIAQAADTTLVVLNPGWGDGIQAAKAGILEIGDLFVINKADRPGVEDTRRDLTTMLAMGSTGAWTPPIVETVASTGAGVPELWEAIGTHRSHLETDGLAERRVARRRADLVIALATEYQRRAHDALEGSAHARDVEAGVLDPWAAARHIADELGSE